MTAAAFVTTEDEIDGSARIWRSAVQMFKAKAFEAHRNTSVWALLPSKIRSCTRCGGCYIELCAIQRLIFHLDLSMYEVSM